MRQYTIEELKSAISKKGYKWLDDGREDFLNIIGIRSSDNTPNKFNDVICLVYQGKHLDGSLTEVLFQFNATTKPGTYWLNKPGSDIVGTAILVPGQYVDSWALGMHQGKYQALTQIKSVKLFRDKNKDSKLDYVNVKESGLVGINIHRANAEHESIQVDKWSAGCSVIANPKDFDILMTLARSSVKIRGNQFTYTLLEEKDLE